MAGDPDQDDRDFIAENMDADLQFILSESGVSLHRQAAIARRYGSLKKFNAIGDDRAQLRVACLQDLPSLRTLLITGQRLQRLLRPGRQQRSLFPKKLNYGLRQRY